jgi:hypothetical protein
LKGFFIRILLLLIEEECPKGEVVINLKLPPPTPSLKRRGENFHLIKI